MVAIYYQAGLGNLPHSDLSMGNVAQTTSKMLLNDHYLE